MSIQMDFLNTHTNVDKSINVKASESSFQERGNQWTGSESGRERERERRIRNNLPAPNASPITLIEVRIRSLRQNKTYVRQKFNFGISRRETWAGNEKLNDTYKNQSTAMIIEISCVGNPTAVRTRSRVTRPAEGIEAAPMEAAVAVKLTTITSPMLNSIPFICAMKSAATAS